MAENTIDTLELQISSTADAAVRSINNMSKALQGVNNTLTGLNSHGLRSYAKGIGQVTAAIQSLNSANTGNIAKAVTQLKALSNIDFSKFSAFFQAYIENTKLDMNVDWEAIYYANNGRLGWLEFNIKRSLMIDCDTEEEKQIGINEVKETIEHVVYYDKIKDEILSNINNLIYYNKEKVLKREDNHEN